MLKGYARCAVDEIPIFLNAGLHKHPNKANIHPQEILSLNLMPLFSTRCRMSNYYVKDLKADYQCCELNQHWARLREGAVRHFILGPVVQQWMRWYLQTATDIVSLIVSDIVPDISFMILDIDCQIEFQQELQYWSFISWRSNCKIFDIGDHWSSRLKFEIEDLRPSISKDLDIEVYSDLWYLSCELQYRPLISSTVTSLPLSQYKKDGDVGQNQTPDTDHMMS